jgi:putative transposase
LNAHWFESLSEARNGLIEWRQDYNEVRPHSSLEDRTPAEFLAGSLKTNFPRVQERVRVKDGTAI